MGKISTSIIKTSFSKDNVNNYNLSILCGVDSLYYCISDEANEALVLKKFDLFKTITFESEITFAATLNNIWESDSILSLPFRSIHIAFIHPHYTIIPNKLYQASNKASYLTPLKKETNLPELYQVNDLAIDAKLIFSLPQTAVAFFENKYQKGIHYYNSFTPLLNGILKEMQQLNDKHIWLNVHPRTLQIALFDGKSLIFSNQFPFQSENDFLYYVLLVYNQFKLDPELIPVHISGQLVKESAIHKKLYRYIRNISFLKLSETHQLNTHLTESPGYFFFDLLSIGT